MFARFVLEALLGPCLALQWACTVHLTNKLKYAFKFRCAMKFRSPTMQCTIKLSDNSTWPMALDCVKRISSASSTEPARSAPSAAWPLCPQASLGLPCFILTDRNHVVRANLARYSTRCWIAVLQREQHGLELPQSRLTQAYGPTSLMHCCTSAVTTISTPCWTPLPCPEHSWGSTLVCNNATRLC
jgi:hypothetical protein